MNELHITRSSDIELYIGNEPLFGVTDFQAKCAVDFHPILEYLSAAPCAEIAEGCEYEIRMSVLSLFRFALTEQDGFSVRVVDGDTSVIYEDCTVIRHECAVKAGKAVVDEFVIKAKDMRKQVQSHVG